MAPGTLMRPRCAPWSTRPSAKCAPLHPNRPDAPPAADTGLAELRRVVDDLVVSARAMGELFLEVAPAYLSDTTAADVLGPLCDAIGEDLDTGLATAATHSPETAAPCTAPCCDRKHGGKSGGKYRGKGGGKGPGKYGGKVHRRRACILPAEGLFFGW